MDEPIKWYDALSHIISGAAVLAAMTPRRWDNLMLKALRGALDALAFNWGNAKNTN